VELRHLRAFVAVAEELHFGRAARRLLIAQPAVSQLVRGLEAELGVPLFDRTSRRVSLTWAGQVLLDEARDLLARQTRLTERMERVRKGETGEIGLGTIPALPPDLIPSLLTELRDRLPDVRVVARSLPSGLTAAAALERPDVDIALLRGQVSEPGVSTV
jgi:DNA-binding transcriptional LysR family regulator